MPVCASPITPSRITPASVRLPADTTVRARCHVNGTIRPERYRDWLGTPSLCSILAEPGRWRPHRPRRSLGSHETRRGGLVPGNRAGLEETDFGRSVRSTTPGACVTLSGMMTLPFRAMPAGWPHGFHRERHPRPWRGARPSTPQRAAWRPKRAHHWKLTTTSDPDCWGDLCRFKGILRVSLPLVGTSEESTGRAWAPTPWSGS
jgi:hypothetical protein